MTPSERSGENSDWYISLDAIRSRRVADDEGKPLFGEQLIEVERGKAAFRLPITPAVGGGAAGGVHGGVLSALADISVTTAVLSVCRRNDQMRGTAELNISYLRPAQGNALTATATIIKKGRMLVVGQVDITNDDGTVVATARVTYALTQKQT